MDSNGIYIARKTDNGVQSVHIEEDVLWFAKLNKRNRNRMISANKRAGRRMKALRSTVKWSTAMFALATGLLAAHFMGYIVPFIALPGTAVCLCIANYKIGLFVGQSRRDERKVRNECNKL